MPRYIGGASVKGKKLFVTNGEPPSDTEEAARKASEEVKRELRSIGVPYTKTKIITIRGEGDN